VAHGHAGGASPTGSLGVPSRAHAPSRAHTRHLARTHYTRAVARTRGGGGAQQWGRWRTVADGREGGRVRECVGAATDCDDGRPSSTHASPRPVYMPSQYCRTTYPAVGREGGAAHRPWAHHHHITIGNARSAGACEAHAARPHGSTSAGGTGGGIPWRVVLRVCRSLSDAPPSTRTWTLGLHRRERRRHLPPPTAWCLLRLQRAWSAAASVAHAATAAVVAAAARAAWAATRG
jgi:hypothetical protein